MSILILYSSKYGATAECAHLLAREMAGAAVHDLETGAPALEGVGTVLVGGPIYAGMLRKATREFCKSRQETLLAKKLGLFLCCTTPEEAGAFFTQNFPAPLLAHATAQADLGGVLPTDGVKAMDRMILKMVAKSRGEAPPPHIDTEAIRRFARDMA